MPKPRSRPRPGHAGKTTSRSRDLRIGEILERAPRAIEVLDKYGVHFCAGCFFTLMSPPRKAAGYHAVRDVAAFLRDLKRRLGAGGLRA